MAIKLGLSSKPDERFGFGESGGSWNSPFEAERFRVGVCFVVKKVKEIFLFL